MMAKFGLFNSGDTTNKVQLEFEGDHLKFLINDMVCIYKDPGQSNVAAIVRLAQGQSVKKID
jgi:hypothetical protein